MITFFCEIFKRTETTISLILYNNIILSFLKIDAQNELLPCDESASFRVYILSKLLLTIYFLANPKLMDLQCT